MAEASPQGRLTLPWPAGCRRAWPDMRRPLAERGIIANDFAFHVDSAANKLPNPHDHGRAASAAGKNPDRTGTPGHRREGTRRPRPKARADPARRHAPTRPEGTRRPGVKAEYRVVQLKGLGAEAPAVPVGLLRLGQRVELGAEGGEDQAGRLGVDVRRYPVDARWE